MGLFTVLVIGVVVYVFIGLLFRWWAMLGMEDVLDGITSQKVKDLASPPLLNQILGVTLWPAWVLPALILFALGKTSGR